MHAASPSLAAGSMSPGAAGRWWTAAVGSLLVALAAAAAAVLIGPHALAVVALFVLDAALAGLVALVLRRRPSTPGPLRPYAAELTEAPRSRSEPAAPVLEAIATEPSVPEPEVLVSPSAEPEPASPAASVAGSFAWRAPGAGARPDAAPNVPVEPSSMPFAGVEAAAHLTPVGPQTPWITERPPSETPEEALAARERAAEPLARPTPAIAPTRAGGSRLDLSTTPALRWSGPSVPRSCVGCGRSSPTGPTTLACVRCGRALCPDCYWGAPPTAGGRRCPECRRAEGSASSMARSGARRADRLSPGFPPPGPSGEPRRR